MQRQRRFTMQETREWLKFAKSMAWNDLQAPAMNSIWQSFGGFTFGMASITWVTAYKAKQVQRPGWWTGWKYHICLRKWSYPKIKNIKSSNFCMPCPWVSMGLRWNCFWNEHLPFTLFAIPSQDWCQRSEIRCLVRNTTIGGRSEQP